MTNFKFANLSLADYLDIRYSFLETIEENNKPKLSSYVDSKGIATIGVGMNLRDVYVRNIVINEILKNYLPLSESQVENFKAAIANIANHTYPIPTTKTQEAINALLQADLNSVMVQYFGVGSSFAFNDNVQIKDVFDIISKEYEERVDKWFGADNGYIPNSIERAVFVSLSYNGVLAESKKLREAILSNNRAEAWYEIRYGSNRNHLDGIAKRRYFESEIFKLYDDDLSDKEAKDVLMMYIKHKSVIDSYESTYSSQITKDYNNGVVKTLKDSLAPAKSYLISHYAIHDIDNIIIQSDGDDVLDGGSGRDLIFGEGGSDVIDGGSGDDILLGGGGSDTYIFRSNFGIDVINDDGIGDGVVKDQIKVDDVILSGVAKFREVVAGNDVIDVNINNMEIYVLGNKTLTLINSKNGSKYLIISSGSNKVIINNYTNGDYGITLEEKPKESGDQPPLVPIYSDNINDLLSNIKNAKSLTSPPRYDPLAFDLNNNGQIDLIALSKSRVFFDLDNDTVREQVGEMCAL